MRPWMGVVAGVLGLALLVWALLRLGDVFAPFAAAFGGAYFLNPAVNLLERFFERDLQRSRWLRGRVHPRGVAVGLLVVTVTTALVLLAVFVVPALYHQVADAVAKIPDYARVVRDRVEPLYRRLNLQYPEHVEEVRRRLQQALEDNLPQVLSPLTRVLRAAFSSVLSFFLTVLNLLVVPVFAVYLLYDMNRINAGLRELVPHRFRPYVYSRLAEVDRLLSAFVRGQITVCLLLGSFYAVGLTGCGVPMGLLVGFLVGFFNLIPFMSYILGLPLALVLSWVDDQSSARLLAVAAVFTFGQFVEGNFITPRIVGERLGLHAVVIMLAVLVGGTLFGFLGMLLAVPTTAALSVFWADLKELYVKSDFYGRGAPSPSA